MKLSSDLVKTRLWRRFLFGWGVKLGLLAVVYLVMTGALKPTLPDTVLGHEVPPLAKRWVERGAEINDIAARTQAGFREISDKLK